MIRSLTNSQGRTCESCIHAIGGVVCYTAVFVSSRNVPPHKRLLRTEPHSFSAVNQLEFSSLFLEGVCAKVTPPITAFLLSVLHV